MVQGARFISATYISAVAFGLSALTETEIWCDAATCLLIGATATLPNPGYVSTLTSAATGFYTAPLAAA